MDIRTVISARGVALAATVLTLGLGAGAATSVSLASASADAATAALALRTAGVRAALDATFQRYADTLHALAATAARLPALTPVIVANRLPGAHQVTLLDPGYQVLAQHTADGSTPPAPARLIPEPALAHILDLSRPTGRVTTGPAHVLSADLSLPPAHRQPAFELAAPIQHGTFTGWVVVSVRAGDLLRAALTGQRGVAATWAETSPDGVSHDVAQWSEGGSPTGPRTRVEVALAEHTWQVQIRPTTALVATTRAVAAPLTLVCSMVISLLAAVIVLSADATRSRALRVARRAVTRESTAIAGLRDRDAELAGFAATAGAHLRAPLHTIAGFTDLLLEDTAAALDEDTRGFLDRIGRSTDRMLGTVDELVAYTETVDTALNLEPVDAQSLARSVAAAVTTAGDGEQPSIDVGTLPLLTADAELLRRVLTHLVGNAVRFVRHGAAARVTVGAVELAGGWWRIEIGDRGIGVPAEHRDRIFAPFHRAPAAEGYPGTGLGLAVCRGIVALHGGEIGMRANPGGGSVFWFTVSAAGVTLSATDLTALAAA